MEDFFPYKFKSNQTKDLKKLISLADKTLANYNDEAELTSYSMEDLTDLSYRFTQADLLIRTNTEEVEKDKGHYYDDEFDVQCIKQMPVKMDFDGETFILKTPFTIKRASSKSMYFMKENYIFLNYVHAEIKRWLKENDGIRLKFNPNFTNGNLVFIVARYSKVLKPQNHPDHDNLENGRIQNSICSALGISDRIDVMDYYSLYRNTDQDEEVGMKFIVTNRKNLFKYI